MKTQRMTEKPIEKYSFRKTMKKERLGVGCPTHLIRTKPTIHLELGGRREYEPFHTGQDSVQPPWPL
jgi:hypothetical protein